MQACAAGYDVNSRNYSETEVSRLNGRNPDRRQI
jgi:hypothetical protein